MKQIEREPDLFPAWKENIRCRLMNKSTGDALLQDMPYYEWMDLAMTCYYTSHTSEEAQRVIPVTWNMLDAWQCGKEELFALAWKNLHAQEPGSLRRMEEVLGKEILQEQRGEGPQDPEKADSIQLYVLTTEKAMFGAICLADAQLLQDAAEKLGGSYYVLPSSIHEVLLLPEPASYSVEELNAMVHSINQTQVAEQERLADHVYYYHADLAQLLSCPRASVKGRRT